MGRHQAGEKYKQMLKDVDAIRTAATTEEAWFTKQLDEGKKLQKEFDQGLLARPRSDREVWLKKVQGFLDQQPKKNSEPLPNSTSISYVTVYRMHSVENASKQFERYKENLASPRRRRSRTD